MSWEQRFGTPRVLYQRRKNGYFEDKYSVHEVYDEEIQWNT